jgi:hypothetical protein
LRNQVLHVGGYDGLRVGLAVGAKRSDGGRKAAAVAVVVAAEFHVFVPFHPLPAVFVLP